MSSPPSPNLNSDNAATSIDHVEQSGGNEQAVGAFNGKEEVIEARGDVAAGVGSAEKLQEAEAGRAEVHEVEKKASAIGNTTQEPISQILQAAESDDHEADGHADATDEGAGGAEELGEGEGEGSTGGEQKSYAIPTINHETSSTTPSPLISASGLSSVPMSKNPTETSQISATSSSPIIPINAGTNLAASSGSTIPRSSSPLATGSAGSAAPKKFSTVNLNRKFLGKSGTAGGTSPGVSAAVPSGLGGSKPAAGLGSLARPSATPLSNSATPHRLTSAKLTSVITSKPTAATGALSSAPSVGWAKHTPVPSNASTPSAEPTPAQANQEAGRGGLGGLGGMGMGGRRGQGVPPPMGSGQGLTVAKRMKGWGTMGMGEGYRGMGMDFPTTSEVMEGQRQAQAAADVRAAHNAAILEGLDSFRGMNRDPNIHYWDEDDENDAAEQVIDFGDGTTYTIPALPAPQLPSQRQDLESSERSAPAPRDGRFAEDFDRSWPPRNAAPNDAAGGRAIFNDRLNRFEARAEGNQPQQQPRQAVRPQILERTSREPERPQASSLLRPAAPPEPATRARDPPSHDRGLPPHMAERDLPRPMMQAQALDRPLPPHLAAAGGDAGLSSAPRRVGHEPDHPPHMGHMGRTDRYPPVVVDPRANSPEMSARPDRWANRERAPPPPPPHALPPARPAVNDNAGFGQGRRRSSVAEQISAARSRQSLSPEVTRAVLSGQSDATSPAPPAGSQQDIEEIQKGEMHTAAERARLRRQQEEAEREAQAERARRKAKELEERLAKAAGGSNKPEMHSNPRSPVAVAREIVAPALSRPQANIGVPPSASNRREYIPEPPRPTSWTDLGDASQKGPKGLAELKGRNNDINGKYRLEPSVRSGNVDRGVPPPNGAAYTPQFTGDAPNSSLLRPVSPVLRSARTPLDSVASRALSRGIPKLTEEALLAIESGTVTASEIDPSEDAINTADLGSTNLKPRDLPPHLRGWVAPVDAPKKTASREHGRLKPQDVERWRQDTQGVENVPLAPLSTGPLSPVTLTGNQNTSRADEVSSSVKAAASDASPRAVFRPLEDGKPAKQSKPSTADTDFDSIMARIRSAIVAENTAATEARQAQPLAEKKSLIKPAQPIVSTPDEPVDQELASQTGALVQPVPRLPAKPPVVERSVVHIDANTSIPDTVVLPQPDDFSITLPSLPSSPRPAWKTFAARLPRAPPLRKPYNRARTRSENSPQPPKGWILSWDPPFDQLNPATLSRDNWLAPSTYVKGKPLTQISLPKTRFSPYTKPPPPPPTVLVQTTQEPAAQPHSDALSPGMSVEGGAETARRINMEETRSAESAARKIVVNLPKRKVTPGIVSPADGKHGIHRQIESRPEAMAPLLPEAVQTTTDIDLLLSPTGSEVVLPPPRDVDVPNHGPIRQVSNRRLPEGAVLAFTQARAPSFSEDPEAQMSVRFMVSSELEGDNLLEEVNNMSMDGLTETILDPVHGSDRGSMMSARNKLQVAPTSPEHQASAAWGRAPGKFMQSPQRGLPDRDHIKNVWSQPESDTMQQSNSLMGIADDLPPALPISVQDLRDEADKSASPGPQIDMDSPRFASIGVGAENHGQQPFLLSQESSDGHPTGPSYQSHHLANGGPGYAYSVSNHTPSPHLSQQNIRPGSQAGVNHPSGVNGIPGQHRGQQGVWLPLSRAGMNMGPPTSGAGVPGRGGYAAQISTPTSPGYPSNAGERPFNRGSQNGYGLQQPLSSGMYSHPSGPLDSPSMPFAQPALPVGGYGPSPGSGGFGGNMLNNPTQQQYAAMMAAGRDIYGSFGGLGSKQNGSNGGHGRYASMGSYRSGSNGNHGPGTSAYEAMAMGMHQGGYAPSHHAGAVGNSRQGGTSGSRGSGAGGQASTKRPW